MDRIVHSTAVDIGGGRRGFRSKDTVAGLAGTVVTAAHMNAEQEEIMAVIEKSGLVPDPADLVQLARAIRSQRLNYAIAGGSANALTATLDPAPASNAALAPAPLRLLIAATNTGAATLAVNGFGALPIQRLDGQPAQRGDLPGGAVVTLLATGTSYRLAGVVYSEFKRLLSDNLTVWVRTDGSDNNDGSANTAAGAFKTLQGALDRVSRLYDLAGYTLTVRLGMAGTYAGGVIGSFAGPVEIIGDAVAGAPDRANYVVNLNGSGRESLSVYANAVTVRGLTLYNVDSTDPSAAAIVVGRGGGLVTRDIRLLRFGSNMNSGSTFISVASGGTLTSLGKLDIVGAVGVNIGSILRADTGGQIYVGNPGDACAMTVSNLALAAGSVFASGSGGVSFINAVITPTSITGPRYLATLNGTIQTSGGGANYLPGSAAGSTNTGGQYV